MVASLTALFHSNDTSFPSFIAAGLAGLIWSVNPLLTNEEVVNLLQNNADDLGVAGFDELFGYGRINVLASLQAAQEFIPVPDSTSPTVTLTSPEDGSTISGTLTTPLAGESSQKLFKITATATDNVGVSQLNLFIDGSLVQSVAGDLVSCTWVVRKASAGAHTISVQAYDAVGQVGTDSITVYR